MKQVKFDLVLPKNGVKVQKVAKLQFWASYFLSDFSVPYHFRKRRVVAIFYEKKSVSPKQKEKNNFV